jgi:hypothetical protein
MPLSFAAEFPDMYAKLGRQERDARAVIGSDQCLVDEKWFFIRGCLEVPIIGAGEPFLWGLWASIREGVFDEISDSWEIAEREKTHGPFKGRIANSLPIYPETLNLKIQITIQPVGTRPLFALEEPEHLLAVEQQCGITRERALELAVLLLHQET